MSRKSSRIKKRGFYLLGYTLIISSNKNKEVFNVSMPVRHIS